MNKKINKERSEDLFAGLKFVDNMLNEAAGVNSNPKLSLDQRLKKRLTESMDETSTADVSMEENTGKDEQGEVATTTSITNESLDEYTYSGDNYNYNHDGKEVQHESEDEDGEDKTKNFYDKSLEEDEDPDLLEMLLEDDDTLAVEDPTADVNTDPTAAGLGAEDSMGAPDLGGATDLGGTDPMAGDDLGAGTDPMAGADDLGGAMADLGGSAPMGGAPDMGGDAMGGDMAVAPTGGMDVTSSPEDIDALIDGLLLENQELKDLGYEDLGDDEIAGKVNGTKNVGKKVTIDAAPASATETVDEVMNEGKETPKSTPLGDDDLTGKVKGASDTNKSGEPESANKDLKFTNAADKDFPSTTVKGTPNATVSQPNFDKVKKESEIKDKALVILANKVAVLEGELKALKLENYKAKKVNAILTLAELKASTREALVTKFSEAKDFSAVNKLYKDVQGMIKESKRPSLNEAVTKATKSVKTIIAESNTENDGSESEEQKRKNFLMGMPGYDDSYGS